ncbi:MAG TPA: hypothetical protein VFV99_01015 [Kofleriaceae bacterium]|nr:hypothetical protein [Kofleriaceae bacterium]
MKTFAAITTLVGVGLAVAVASTRRSVERVPTELPATLRETGLYADWDRKEVAAANRPFTPQYPLWTDAARKRRWIYLPRGAAIDASNPDAWQFPVGTRLWKEFSFGARTETRFMMRTRDGWKFATYVWTADGSDAVRAPNGGPVTAEVAPGVRHQVPAEGECHACHGNGATPVLGFSALQLSPDRDPNALHSEQPAPGSLDLNALVAAKLVLGLPASARAPRIPGPPVERAALGYLHGNCGHCHRADGAVASVGMVLAYSVVRPPATHTAIAQPSKFMAPHVRVAPGDAEQSVVIARMRTRSPVEQMPPLGTQLVDEAAVHLIATWIDQLAPSQPTGESK